MTELSKRLIGVAAALVVVALVVPASLDAILPGWIAEWVQEVGVLAASVLVLLMALVGLGIWAWARLNQSWSNSKPACVLDKRE